MAGVTGELRARERTSKLLTERPLGDFMSSLEFTIPKIFRTWHLVWIGHRMECGEEVEISLRNFFGEEILSELSLSFYVISNLHYYTISESIIYTCINADAYDSFR